MAPLFIAMNKNLLNRRYLWEHLLERAADPTFFAQNEHLFSRRAMLSRCFNGIGALGIAAAMSNASAANSASAVPTGPENPLAPKLPHFAAKAKHVIHLWMNGAPSQV